MDFTSQERAFTVESEACLRRSKPTELNGPCIEISVNRNEALRTSRSTAVFVCCCNNIKKSRCIMTRLFLHKVPWLTVQVAKGLRNLYRKSLPDEEFCGTQKLAQAPNRPLSKNPSLAYLFQHGREEKPSSFCNKKHLPTEKSACRLIFRNWGEGRERPPACTRAQRCTKLHTCKHTDGKHTPGLPFAMLNSSAQSFPRLPYNCILER